MIRDRWAGVAQDDSSCCRSVPSVGRSSQDERERGMYGTKQRGNKIVYSLLYTLLYTLHSTHSTLYTLYSTLLSTLLYTPLGVTQSNVTRCIIARGRGRWRGEGYPSSNLYI